MATVTIHSDCGTQEIKSVTVSTFSPFGHHEVIGPDAKIFLPWWLRQWRIACSAGDLGSIPGLGRSPEKGMATYSGILLPGESHGWRSLVGWYMVGCYVGSQRVGCD